VPRPRLEITYCTQCRWLLRAGWTAQELLTTFPADLGEVALVRRPLVGRELVHHRHDRRHVGRSGGTDGEIHGGLHE